MSTNSQDQEIDLGQIGTGIKNFFNGVLNSIFDFIFLLKRNNYHRNFVCCRSSFGFFVGF